MLPALALHSPAERFVNLHFFVRGTERLKVLRMCPTATGPGFERDKGEELPCQESVDLHLCEHRISH